jgi:hypothetical protein
MHTQTHHTPYKSPCTVVSFRVKTMDFGRNMSNAQKGWCSVCRNHIRLDRLLRHHKSTNQTCFDAQRMLADFLYRTAYFDCQHSWRISLPPDSASDMLNSRVERTRITLAERMKINAIDSSGHLFGFPISQHRPESEQTNQFSSKLLTRDCRL